MVEWPVMEAGRERYNEISHKWSTIIPVKTETHPEMADTVTVVTMVMYDG